MKDLSLFALDIAQNSVTAGCRTLVLEVWEGDGLLVLTVSDDGCGMSPELLSRVTDPFTTTRTTRKTGMGLPLLRMAAELTGGTLTVESAEGRGTRVTARFYAQHIDCVPLGDMGDTLSLLLYPEIKLSYTHTTPSGQFHVDTDEMKAMLGPGISPAEPEVALWLQDYVREQEAILANL